MSDEENAEWVSTTITGLVRNTLAQMDVETLLAIMRGERAFSYTVTLREVSPGEPGAEVEAVSSSDGSSSP